MSSFMALKRDTIRLTLNSEERNDLISLYPADAPPIQKFCTAPD